VAARGKTAAAIAKAGDTGDTNSATSGTNSPVGGAPVKRAKGSIRAAFTVAVEEVRQEDIEEWVMVPGTVTPLQIVTVRSRVEGELQRLNFEEGRFVKAGDVLAEIDPRPFQIELDRRRASKLRNEALLADARASHRRNEELLAAKLIALQVFESQASLVQQLEAGVAADAAAVAAAELDLSYTKITAPISGRVGLRRVDAGNMVRPSDLEGLVVITQMDPAGLLFSVPQDRVAAVRQRMDEPEPVRVQVLHSDQKRVLAEGRLLAADNQISTASGTLRLKAEVPNADGALFPNQFVMAKLLVSTLRGATVAPANGVLRGARGAYAYVAGEEGTVTLRWLQTGLMSGDRVAIEEGLQPGDKIVVQGADRLRDGARVRIASAAPAAKPAVTTNAPSPATAPTEPASAPVPTPPATAP
jgi:multidrug efflux system membrane fusion protein